MDFLSFYADMEHENDYIKFTQEQLPTGLFWMLLNPKVTQQRTVFQNEDELESGHYGECIRGPSAHFHNLVKIFSDSHFTDENIRPLKVSITCIILISEQSWDNIQLLFNSKAYALCQLSGGESSMHCPPLG